mmetsp:Transcript_31544/g.79980  ORF Transcript_31544/g.79980 Transcript_31544/m.79980 type:complete len:211 (-) Transcript_31544:98-730(-)
MPLARYCLLLSSMRPPSPRLVILSSCCDSLVGFSNLNPYFFMSSRLVRVTSKCSGKRMILISHLGSLNALTMASMSLEPPTAEMRSLGRTEASGCASFQSPRRPVPDSFLTTRTSGPTSGSPKSPRDFANLFLPLACEKPNLAVSSPSLSNTTIHTSHPSWTSFLTGMTAMFGFRFAPQSALPKRASEELFAFGHAVAAAGEEVSAGASC